MRNRLLVLAATALLSGAAAVSAQDVGQSPKSQTKDQIARPDAQPGAGEDQKGSAGGGEQVTQPSPKSDRKLQGTQLQGGQRDQIQGKKRGPQGGEMRRGAPHVLTVEQRTKFLETVVKTGPRLTHINFRIGVGVAIPRTVR